MPMSPPRRAPLAALAMALAVALAWAAPASAQQTVNAYSIWPENWARPMFEEFEKATGIKVNFVRFSSGEALARVTSRRPSPSCPRASSRPTGSGWPSPTTRSSS